MVANRDLIGIDPLTPHKLDFWFHPGQTLAWEATERIVAVIAGTQSGKTTFGPLWLRREMEREGPGDYLIAAPTDPLLQVKLIPAFRDLFVDKLGLGVMVQSPRPKFILSKKGEKALWGAEQTTPTIVWFGYAAKPESLESMTAKAAWLDEAGQPEFKLGSWEAVLRRLSLSRGRILITTTPYVIGHWLRRKILESRDPNVRVIQFKSIWNPQFPREEWEERKRDLPRWKFRMMYCGEFTKPAGQIYDVFGSQHIVPRFAIPERWKRFLGLDFGGVNTAGVFLAERPEDKALFAYRTYHAGNRTSAQHVAAIRRSEPRDPITYGGAKSEDAWRLEYRAAGLRVHQPTVTDVEAGIDRVYTEFANSRLYVFEDLDPLIDEAENYARVVDQNGEPTDTIADKNSYHHLDGLRYVIGSIRGSGVKSGYHRHEPGQDPDEYTEQRRAEWYGNR